MGKPMVPVGAIADLIVEELGDNTAAKKFRILRYIALGFDKMNFLLNQDIAIRSFIIDVDGQTQFELDCSMQYPTKVGIRKKAANGKPPGKLCVLDLKTDMMVSCEDMNDTDTLNALMASMAEEPCGSCDCYFYNSPCGTICGYGRGHVKNNYYSYKDGVLNISPYLHKLGEDLEIIVEGQVSALIEGIKLVPSECFLALYYFARARYFGEDQFGPNELLWESEFNTLNRVYNFRSINYLTELFKG